MLPDPVAVPKVLVIEDDADIRLGCEQAMQLAGIEVLQATSADCAQTILGPGFSGVVVAGMRLPGMDGPQFVQFARGLDVDLPVIVITVPEDVALAGEAMRSGAYDCIEKPFSPEHLVEVVKRALEKRRLTLEVEGLRRRLYHGDDMEAQMTGHCTTDRPPLREGEETLAPGAGQADASPPAGMTLSEAVETFERALIAAELQRQSGNVSRSSEALGVPRTTLHDKMRKYGLN